MGEREAERGTASIKILMQFKSFGKINQRANDLIFIYARIEQAYTSGPTCGYNEGI
jgi:hypothetical protein